MSTQSAIGAEIGTAVARDAAEPPAGSAVTNGADTVAVADGFLSGPTLSGPGLVSCPRLRVGPTHCQHERERSHDKRNQHVAQVVLQPSHGIPSHCARTPPHPGSAQAIGVEIGMGVPGGRAMAVAVGTRSGPGPSGSGSACPSPRADPPTASTSTSVPTTKRISTWWRMACFSLHLRSRPVAAALLPT
jgi:hypothetical protein